MEFAPPSLNLGIVAHVDAGKTSLTERLLHAAGVIDELGRVDEGSTQTDTLDLERQRGMTIRASVVSFELGQPERPVTVNLVDTPGHSDFIAEVERSLAVLDGAVLVISAVEGVQAQTRVLMRVLTRLQIPTLLYVNKIDRPGARGQSLLPDIRERLTDKAIPLGSVTGAGTSSAAYVPFGKDDERQRARLADLLSEHDDALLRDWVGNADGVTTRRLERALAQQARRGLVHPLLHGSAVTGAGLDEVARAITTYLPVRRPDVGGPLAGSVFKVERGRSGEKLALVHLTRGRLGVRDKVRFGDVADRVTAIRVHDRGVLVRSTSVAAGRMAEVVGLESARVGDPIGDGALERSGPQFSPPTLETVVEPVRPVDRGRMYAALTRLAETDPLINLRHDDARGETHVSLYGEVQKEVIAATLATEHGVPVRFRETTVICVERVVGTGAAVEVISVAPNPYLATVGLRVAAGAPGSGVTFGLDVELGSMPPAFFRAVEESVHETLAQGLRGWPVLDCAVTMTASGYYARQGHAHQKFSRAMSSTAGDFRGLTPLVLMAALRQAGTLVEEPMHRFDVDLPAAALGPALRLLSHLRAVPRTTHVHGAVAHLGGLVPAAHVHELQQRLPDLTGGEGDLVCEFERYAPVTGDQPPSRNRTGPDPLDRRTYVLEVRR